MIEIETVKRPPRARRIAVIRALQLGDLLVAVPALRSLRAGYPDAEITLIGLPWAESFVRRFSRYLDRFVPFGGWPGIGELDAESEQIEAFVHAQRAQQYDLVLQMHGSGIASNPLALALGGRVTAGYYVGTRPEGLAYASPYPETAPEILRNLSLVRLLGCPDTGTALEFPLGDGDRAEAERLLAPVAGRQPLVGIHPGARPPARRWAAEKFAAVADSLATRHGARIVLTGGPGEEALAQAVEEHMTTRALNLAGKTSLGGLAAVIDSLDLYVGNDTGTAHLAVAVDTPSVVLFGPADPVRWAPLDGERHPIVRRAVGCNPCGYWNCPIDHRCLGWIEPEDVLITAERLIAMGVAA